MFIKSFSRFTKDRINFKFELVERRDLESTEGDLILENKDQAYKILYQKNVPEDNPDFIRLKDEVEKLFKNLNYLGLMTKYVFTQDVSIQEIIDLLPWLRYNGNRLPKNPLQYKKFENLKDDIIKVDNDQRVKTIYDLLPRDQKDLVKGDPIFYEKALAIHKLGSSKKFGKKVSLYKTKEGLIEYMDDYLKKNSEQITFDSVVEDLKKLNTKIFIEDIDNGFIMAEILDYSASKEMGSSDWCIVTSKSSFDNYTRGTRRQFFMWDFSEDITSSMFLIGFTSNEIGQITNIHDKYDISLSGNIPQKIKDSLKSVDISIDPFEYKQRILKEIEKRDTIEKISFDLDRNILITKISENDDVRSIGSGFWGYYSPFFYGTEVEVIYAYIIYNFDKDLRSPEFCYAFELSDDEGTIVIKVKDNTNSNFRIKINGSNITTDIEDQNTLDFIVTLYNQGYIKAKDVSEIYEEKKNKYLDEIEKYVKGSEEISHSYHDKKSKYINTSDDPGSTGNIWLFKIENGETGKFETDFIKSWDPHRGEKITKSYLYVVINLDEGYSSPDFVRFVKVGEDSKVIQFNSRDEADRKSYKNVSDLPQDIQKLIEDGHILVKTNKDYQKEYFKEREKIFSDSEEEYENNPIRDLYARALIDYLIKYEDLDLEDHGYTEEEYEEDEDAHRKILIPDGDHYGDLLSFVEYSNSLVTSSWGSNKEWAIGDEDDADDAAKESIKNLLDDIGIEGVSSWVIDSCIDSERFANDYGDDWYYLDELVREDLEGYGIERTMKDGVEEKKEEMEEELEEWEEKLETKNDLLKKAEERLEKYQEFTIDKMDQIEIMIDELEDEEEKNEKRIKRLKIIKSKMEVRFKRNEERYEKFISEVEDDISNLESDIDDYKETIEEMEDEDNDEYWEYDENAIEEKIEELQEDRKKEIEDDPVGWVKSHFGESEVNKMLEDYIDEDKYVQIIIDSDGRGPSLSGYDGVENEHWYEGEYYYIYRIN